MYYAITSLKYPTAKQYVFRTEDELLAHIWRDSTLIYWHGIVDYLNTNVISFIDHYEATFPNGDKRPKEFKKSHIYNDKPAFLKKLGESFERELTDALDLRYINSFSSGARTLAKFIDDLKEWVKTPVYAQYSIFRTKKNDSDMTALMDFLLDHKDVSMVYVKPPLQCVDAKSYSLHYQFNFGVRSADESPFSLVNLMFNLEQPKIQDYTTIIKRVIDLYKGLSNYSPSAEFWEGLQSYG